MQSLDTSISKDVRTRLLEHPVYKELDSAEKVRIFMQHHVFAVWDFMSLLKRLQQLLTSVSLPWMPGKETQYARFINEIVLGEETDEDGQGGYISHFDLYVQAMEEAGADPSMIREFIAYLARGMSVDEALRAVDVPVTVAEFVSYTINLALHGKPHEVAAAFFYGREEIIPDMFSFLVAELRQKGSSSDRLLYYLNRHIELDGDTHGPLAQQLLEFLCAGDPERIAEAQRTAEECLEVRIRLWNGVMEQVVGFGK